MRFPLVCTEQQHLVVQQAPSLRRWGFFVVLDGIVKLSEFDQKLGNTRIHNSLIVQHSGYWPEVENQPNLT